MKKIVLKKIEVTEIQLILAEILNFVTYKNSELTHLDRFSNEFFSEVLILDIGQNMYYNFRGKIERCTKTTSNITLSASEAIILNNICNFNKTIRNHFESFTMGKISNIIHDQLINY